VELPPAVERAVAQKWLGKKSGRGFYIHAADKRGRAAKVQPNEELTALLVTPGHAASPSPQDIQWRLILPMVNEAARTLAEGTTDSADDIDLATVLGLGLAPFRGGLGKFADDVGLAEVERRLDELTIRHGPRFAPAELLRRLASEHRSFPRPATPPRAPAVSTPSPALQEIHS
jgi:3-hydroxyacyl-CoA dehydrogenase